MFKKMPFLLIILILITTLITPYLSFEVKQFVFTTSFIIKKVIVFLLPLVIFGLLFKTVIQLAEKATKIILAILVFICLSNLLSTMLSYVVAQWVYGFNFRMITPNSIQELVPLFDVPLSPFIRNDHAMLIALVTGLFASWRLPHHAAKMAHSIERLLQKLLSGAVLIVPLFILGFIVKLRHDNVMAFIVKDYALIFAIVALAQYTYIGILYMLYSKGRLSTCIAHLQAMLPATICGFSTMSSAASMPLTLLGVEHQAYHKDIARSVVPVSVNFHLIGDCFAIPIFAFAIMKSFGVSEPSFAAYVLFALYFVKQKFAVAAVPGGGILVMLGILESQLGFNAEMISLITALYILFDPVITSANVFGNGVFAKFIDRFFYKVS
ncbi:MAG: cation:dicarboxylase symporter family transporter, partial [Alphaproteobacteria bacterium]|nr:cation:dicarboxylase symporter family transporter [Alphaproteobacteria bacterium]